MTTESSMGCEACQFAVKAAIDDNAELILKTSCGAIVGIWEGICEGIPGIPSDACSNAAAELQKLCEQYGTKWIVDNSAEAARLICVAIGMCSPLGFDSDQIAHIKSRIDAASAGFAKRNPDTNLASDLGCYGCEVGLNVAAGALIAAAIVAGVAVAPEAAVVVAIVEFTGLEAATVVAIINGALSAGIVVTVETIIYECCKAMGACS